VEKIKITMRRRRYKMYFTNDQRVKCHAIIHGASASAAGVGGGLAQIPLSDNAVITPIQIGMIISLGAVLNIKLTKSAAAAILGTVATGTVGRAVSQVVFGWIPGFGNAVNASTAAAITETVGWAAVKYFENMSTEEIKKYSSAKEEGKQEAKAEYEIKLKEINEKFHKACEVIKQYEQLENFVVGAFSIGIAAANIDGTISDNERRTMEFAIMGLGYNTFPDTILNKISQLFYDKPTFNDAMKVIDKVDKKYWALFDNVVEVVLSVDDSDKEQKSAFKAAWKSTYNAA
jgi:uncharacterized protein (DUF697 family)